MIDYERIRKLAKDRRRYIGLTQEELGEDIGVKSKTIYLFESGRTMLQYDNLFKTLNILSISILEYLTDSKVTIKRKVELRKDISKSLDIYNNEKLRILYLSIGGELEIIDDIYTIAKVVRTKREALKLTQDKVSEKIELDMNYYTTFETGKILIGDEPLNKLIDFLKIDRNDFKLVEPTDAQFRTRIKKIVAEYDIPNLEAFKKLLSII